MVRRSTSLRKFIKEVVEQLPKYTKNYSEKDQILLGEFVILLQKCESLADITRSTLSKALEEYNDDIRQRKDYLTLTYLWFIADYFDNANMLLNVSDYHAENYYRYLVQFLRKTPNLDGTFQLIRQQTPLNDPKWELLQYACIEPQILTEEELERIAAVYLLIKKEGLLALNPTRIRSTISNRTLKIAPRRLNRFFNPLRSN